MNPPYDRNLHLKILNNIIEIFPEDVIVNLSPIRWLQDPAAKFKSNSNYYRFENVLNKVNSIEIIDKSLSTDLFNVPFWTDLGIYYLKDGGFDIENFSLNSLGKAYKIIIEKIGVPVYVEKSIQAIINLFGKNSDLLFWIRCPRVHGHVGRKDEFEIVSPDIKYCLNVEDCENKVVYFKTKDEAINFYNTLNSNLFKFIKKVGFYSLSNVFTGLPWLEDYTHHWTDEMLYNYFNFTKEEINIIEEEIKDL